MPQKIPLLNALSFSGSGNFHLSMERPPFSENILDRSDYDVCTYGLTNFQGRYSTDYVSMIAALVVTIIPSILVYAFLDQRIVSGMTAGALKA